MPLERDIMPTTEAKGGIRDRAIGRSGEILFLDPHEVKIEAGFNVRHFNTPTMKQRIEDMARSLSENGQREPVKVRLDKPTGDIYLVSGETRLRGMLLAIKNGAEFKGLKAIIDDTKLSEADRIASLILDNDQKNLEPLEQAEVLARLSKMGFNHTEIAKKTGLSQPYVSSLLGLYAAPTEIKTFVQEGKVSATAATQVLKEHPEQAVSILADSIASAAFNGKGRATAQHIAATKVKKKVGSTSAPLWTQKSVMRNLITTLCEIASDTSLGMKPTQGYRGWAKDALANADVNVKAWLEEYGATTEEEDE